MEGLQKAFRAISENPKLAAASSSTSSFLSSFREEGPPAALSTTPPGVLVTRPPRSVSLWTCSKLGAICFVAGVVVGYTLKRRVRRWVAKLLRRMKDD